MVRSLALSLLRTLCEGVRDTFGRQLGLQSRACVLDRHKRCLELHELAPHVCECGLGGKRLLPLALQGPLLADVLLALLAARACAAGVHLLAYRLQRALSLLEQHFLSTDGAEELLLLRQLPRALRLETVCARTPLDTFGRNHRARRRRRGRHDPFLGCLACGRQTASGGSRSISVQGAIVVREAVLRRAAMLECLDALQCSTRRREGTCVPRGTGRPPRSTVARVRRIGRVRRAATSVRAAAARPAWRSY